MAFFYGHNKNYVAIVSCLLNAKLALFLKTKRLINSAKETQEIKVTNIK